jgi:hypothetical protein
VTDNRLTTYVAVQITVPAEGGFDMDSLAPALRPMDADDQILLRVRWPNERVLTIRYDGSTEGTPPSDRDLLAEALGYLEGHWDDGPRDEGWQSAELMALIERIRGRGSVTDNREADDLCPVCGLVIGAGCRLDPPETDDQEDQ